MKFVVYPGVDDQLRFPPAVRQKLAESTELANAIKDHLDTKVGPAAASAVAATPTVANAAAAAVAQKLSEAGVATGQKPLITDDTIAFTITDAAGNRSWLEIGLDGGPTSGARDLIVSAITAAVNSLIDNKISIFPVPKPILANDTIAYTISDSKGNRSWLEIGMDGGPTDGSRDAIMAAITSSVNTLIDARTALLPLAKSIPDSSGVAYSVTDSQGARSWLEVAPDGGPTQNAVDLLSPKLSIQAVPSSVKPSYGNETIKVASGPDVALFGDSMTASGWDAYLAPAIGRTVIRCGVGGETSVGIAARSNAMPYLMLPEGGSIPASGPVNVTLTSSGGGVTWPLLQGTGTPDGKMRGTLGGVEGVVTLVKGATALPSHGNDDVYVFTRTTAGSAIPMTRPSPFYYVNGEDRRGDITVIWSGRNNKSDPDRVFRDVKAMTNYLKALDKRFLVLSVHNGAGEGTGTTAYNDIATINSRLLAEYGRRFVDHRSYIINYGLADAGITPTAQDTADMAADLIPVSLRSDTLHQNEAGKQITAKQVELRLREFGWV